MKVAIQGIKGSYHHQVAVALYDETELVECTSFNDLASSVAAGSSDLGIMAIGNSIAGSILPNYNLIKDQGLFITGEYYLNINHQLVAVQGQKLEEVKEIQSHPMALLQCGIFLENLPAIKLVETDDTAAAAFRIARDRKNGVAAIASKIAAQEYNLEIIASDIQDVTNNYTRFVVLSSKDDINQEADKATLSFITGHEPGSLMKVLDVFAKSKINLSKIQSIPIVNQPFLFSFVADVEFQELGVFFTATKKLAAVTQSHEILGIYKSQAI
ncbi:prephenate dehydratase [Nonlabens spongiae]|uniref:prephenate dehydratase n=1 Tax=Nonlabens spongiae TaxID=331648 RepID=A0A1W6MMF2_9FLAO|nr:prephenate dehydratase [Nonlabens spongiae]ARN78696.1 prephenate dehydratase [Nonlabens spongiae]